MKNSFKYIAVFFVCCSFSIGNNDIKATSGIDELEAENKTIVSATSSSDNDEVYFQLESVNESEGVYFALKRQYPDGRFETVKYVPAIPVNLVAEGLPTFQTIEDAQVPDEDFTYVMMRIVPADRTFAVLQKWTYCADTHEICTFEILASN